MTEFTLRDVPAQRCLSVERACGIDPDEIGKAMGGAFQQVMAFLGRHGIPPAGRAMSIRFDHDPGTMVFRAGVPAVEADMAAADDAVRGDATPAGRVVQVAHVGPHARLRDTHARLEGDLREAGPTMAVPARESHVDDPGAVPEDRLRVVRVALG